ncbi:hypothetical protein SAMN06295987_102607 [Novosphingobium mathurense]|uniref:HNH endonuclease n=1 Tax=Novosphingobium mathurense TaxID=428990 RepID=A0A1U6HK57_9SPHN|nr:hypothetical protein SAMN06295987_102607 [Novosphingobium mathurense]
MLAKKPFKYGLKTCIFCGKPANSSEHVWPKWAHKLLPQFPNHTQLTLDAPVTKSIMSRTSERKRQGSVAKVAIKRVCSTCNNGWMSAYEENAKAILSAMMRGGHLALGAESQQLLTEYFTFKLMVLDWTNADPIFTQDERTAFYVNRAIPASLQLAMAYCRDASAHSYYRTHFIEAAMKTHLSTHTPGRNVKTIAVGFGGIFIFALCIRGEVDLSLKTIPGFVQLIPGKLATIRWPPFLVIGRTTLERVASSLDALKHHKKVTLIDDPNDAEASQTNK